MAESGSRPARELGGSTRSAGSRRRTHAGPGRPIRHTECITMSDALPASILAGAPAPEPTRPETAALPVSLAFLRDAVSILREAKWEVYDTPRTQPDLETRRRLAARAADPVRGAIGVCRFEIGARLTGSVRDAALADLAAVQTAVEAVIAWDMPDFRYLAAYNPVPGGLANPWAWSLEHDRAKRTFEGLREPLQSALDRLSNYWSPVLRAAAEVANPAPELEAGGSRGVPPQAGAVTQPASPLARLQEQPEQVRGTKGKNIDARMLKVMHENAESHGWSLRQWAAHLDCATSTIAGTKTWRERLKAARATSAVDAACRMDTSRTAPRGRRRKRSP